jgi:hypothetical protein
MWGLGDCLLFGFELQGLMDLTRWGLEVAVSCQRFGVGCLLGIDSRLRFAPVRT